MTDKFTAVWLSHSSINDFLRCPRAYFLKNIYKDRQTGNKIQVTTPSLALGLAVHEVVESLSTIPTEDRFKDSLVLKFDNLWNNYTGDKGGFSNLDEEHQYRERGKAMLRRIMEHPGPLANLSVKLKEEVPYFWLSEDENLILCGKIDWLEYLKDEDSVHILDFKTSKKAEDSDSLQLPIYHLLVHNVQKRPVVKASYWYLDFNNLPTEKELPDLENANKNILEIGRKVKLARKLNKFDCPNGRDGCPACRSLERVLKGEGKKVGVIHRRDTYILPRVEAEPEAEEEDIIL